MRCRIIDMRNKEVINVKTGMRLGCVCDVEVDTKTAKIFGIVIYGRLKCFGLLGRCDDIVIKWEDVVVIGEDTILVKHNMPPQKPRKPKFKALNNFLKF